MTRVRFTHSLLILSGLIFFAGCQPDSSEQQGQSLLQEEGNKLENIRGALDYERMVTMDQATGEVPEGRLYQAYQYAKQLQKEAARNEDAGRSEDLFLHEVAWQSHGPDNIGGRTRAIHIDLRDPERKKVWAGGVTGGLWYTNDITRSDPQWQLVDDFWESISISSVAQDPADPEVFYVGTGEGYTGDARGAGIFKSTDGGITWDLLPSTTGTAFRYVVDILIDPDGSIYAGTWNGGLFRSKDQGGSWEQVLSGGNGNPINDIQSVQGFLFASNASTIVRSETGDPGSWEFIGRGRPGFPTNLTRRVEFTVCPSDPNVIYAIGAVGNPSGGGFLNSSVYFTPNGGANWFEKMLGAQSGFANNQAWYDLEIQINPFNCTEIYAGGVSLIRSQTSGNAWQRIGGLHVDQHIHLYDTIQPGVIYFGNDGGIWRSSNGGQSIQNRNAGYITTQFYACALHPEAGSNYMIGGTQDNNSLQLDAEELGPAEVMLGGDGMFCFIDQDEPNIQIVSLQFGNYVAYLNGFPGNSISASSNGTFVNESDYDDIANILYAQTFSGDYFRWNINSSFADTVDINGLSPVVRSILADPNVDNQVYFGTSNSQLIRVPNAHTGLQVDGELVYDFPGIGSISSIYIDRSSTEDIMVTISNYSLPNNVYVSRDNGATFTGIEGNLPDMPVRWGMFDPADHSRAIIGTQVGLWTTEKIDGANTVWTPSVSVPLVPVRMLQIREADKKVLAATYGRGLYTSDIFASPAAVLRLPKVVYRGQPFVADGSRSILASSFQWDFGDGNTSSDETTEHVYQELGTYQITLVVNGTLTATQEISVLPEEKLPYTEGSVNYGGDFESNPLQFASISDGGSKFWRGNSSITGKNGTASGSFAYVLDPDEAEYAPNTVSYLYTPGFDFSENTLYTLSFQARYLIQNAFDGFKLEYTTDYGRTWKQLGSKSDPGWYNYLNQNIDRGVFEKGESYFTNVVPGWQEFSLDVSALAGETFVGFRFLFKSDDETQNIGLAIDDFSIDRFDGIPETTVIVQNAEYTADSEITISWSTYPEYQATRFEVERSINGITWEVVRSVPAEGRNTLNQQNYTITSSELRPLLYYRILSINENSDIGYAYSFYTPTMVVRRNVDEGIVQKIFPVPFQDHINILFTSVMNEEVNVSIYDVSGKEVINRTIIPNDVILQIPELRLVQGVYILNIQVGSEDQNSYKILSGAL